MTAAVIAHAELLDVTISRIYSFLSFAFGKPLSEVCGRGWMMWSVKSKYSSINYTVLTSTLVVRLVKVEKKNIFFHEYLYMRKVDLAKKKKNYEFGGNKIFFFFLD